jgi:hypothetical protein
VPRVQVDEARRLLGVSEGTDATTLRATYRQLLRRTHPDVSNERDATARTVALTAAYQLLASLPASAEVSHEVPGRPGSTADHQAAGRTGSAHSAAPMQTPPAASRTVHVALLEDQTIGVGAPADETLLLLLEAAHRLGEVSYLDPNIGLLEVVVEFLDAPTSSVLLSLQGRATGVTEVFCTVEPLSGGDAPPGGAVARLVVDTLLAAFDQPPRAQGAAGADRP